MGRTIDYEKRLQRLNNEIEELRNKISELENQKKEVLKMKEDAEREQLLNYIRENNITFEQIVNALPIRTNQKENIA